MSFQTNKMQTIIESNIKSIMNFDYKNFVRLLRFSTSKPQQREGKTWEQTIETNGCFDGIYYKLMDEKKSTAERK